MFNLLNSVVYFCTIEYKLIFTQFMCLTIKYKTCHCFLLYMCVALGYTNYNKNYALLLEENFNIKLCSFLIKDFKSLSIEYAVMT